MKKYFLVVSFIFLLIIDSKSSYAVKSSDYGLKEGDLISAIFSDDPDVYIINEHGYKRLFLNPEIFKFYSHLEGFINIKLVTLEIKDSFPNSIFVRNCEGNDPSVYGASFEKEESGRLHWINISSEQAIQEDPEFFKKVFCVNRKEFEWYPKGQEFKTLTEVPKYDLVKKQKKISIQEQIKAKAESKEFVIPTPLLTRTPSPIVTFSPSPISSPSYSPIFTFSPPPIISPAHSPLPTPVVIASPSFTPPPSPRPTPTPPGSRPTLSNMQRINITANSFTVIWTTDKPSDSTLKYGTHYTVMNSIKHDSNLVINHSITVANLGSGTEYNFQLFSKDSSGNVGEFGMPGSLYYFVVRTLAAPSPTPSPRPTPTRFQGTDGTWCFKSDYYPEAPWSHRVTNKGYCQDHTGIYVFDYCDGNIIKEYTCSYSSYYESGVLKRSTRCGIDGFTCSTALGGGNFCSNGVCTATISSVASKINIAKDFYLGTKGDDVKQIQMLLVNEVGYPANLITGYFGHITLDAVKKLQEKYGVKPASGYFGELTRKALNQKLSH